MAPRNGLHYKDNSGENLRRDLPPRNAKHNFVKMDVNELAEVLADPLNNEQLETFCREIARGNTVNQSARVAGFSIRTCRKPPPGILPKNNPKIAARVRRIQEAIARQMLITVEQLIEECEEVRVGAMQAGQYGAALSAIKEKGVLSGLRIERRETNHRALENLTDAELAAIATGGGPRIIDATPIKEIPNGVREGE